MRTALLLGLASIALGLVAAAASCSSGPSGADDGIPESGPPQHLGMVCEPDTAAKCVGDGGCAGGHLCGADGTYGECVCIGDTDSPGYDAGPPDTGPPDHAIDAPADRDAAGLEDARDSAADGAPAPDAHHHHDAASPDA
jgi:hypothetical protein